MARRKNIEPDRILDAAERVVLNHGAHALTLDMVAAEAAISKGGLTYTFATKEALLSALLNRDLSRFRAQLEALGDAGTGQTYPELRRLVEICRGSAPTAERKAGTILAAVAHAPETLDAAQSYIGWMLSKFSPDTDEGRRARLVFYATQGLIFLHSLGLQSLSVAERNAVAEEFMSFLPHA